jgi:tetratricopeptide (TPR) repeat protein
MNTDRYGLPLSTSSDAAASAYREGVDLLLSAWPGAAARFEAAIATDPTFALAHLARGRIHQMYAEVGPAREAAVMARVLAPNCTPREQGHIDVLASSIEGNPKHAITRAEAYLENHPRDALVLSLLLGAFGLYAFSGRADHDAARVAICERHARHYGNDWWFLTYLGWSHTEAGNAGAGRLLAERALELRRANANGAHALSHALFEQGELRTAASFMDNWLPSYDRAGILNGHLCWHMALGVLDEGDTATALKLYEERIKPTVSSAAPLNVFTDAASLLWRIELAGGARPAEPWADIADYGAQRFPKPGLAFADVHQALVASATGRSLQLDDIEGLRTKDKLAAGPAVIDLVLGLLAFGAGDYASAIPALAAAQTETVRIGGSHAQRELCEDTLIVAYLRAGQSANARALIDRRLHRRPSRRDAAWRAQTTAA